MVKKAVTASAPAKVILFGEHFVVYGEPAVVLAIDKRAYATVQLRSDKRIQIDSTNMGISGIFSGNKFQAKRGGSKARLKLEPIRNCIQQVLDASESKKAVGLSIKINSEIPVSAGLGSSAAVATSTVEATASLLGIGLSREQIFRMAYESERLIHGTPSGIDPAIATYGGTIQFQRGKDFTPLEVQADIPLVVGNTNVERSTGELVAIVRQNKQNFPAIIDPVIKTGGKIALEAVEALKRGDLESVGELMNINHGLLCAVGVSHEALERLVHAARQAGAVGAKLTGGGGGGCMVALPEENKMEQVLNAIVEAGGLAFEARKTDEGVRTEP